MKIIIQMQESTTEMKLEILISLEILSNPFSSKDQGSTFTGPHIIRNTSGEFAA